MVPESHRTVPRLRTCQFCCWWRVPIPDVVASARFDDERSVDRRVGGGEEALDAVGAEEGDALQDQVRDGATLEWGAGEGFRR